MLILLSPQDSGNGGIDNTSWEREVVYVHFQRGKKSNIGILLVDCSLTQRVLVSMPVFQMNLLDAYSVVNIHSSIKISNHVTLHKNFTLIGHVKLTQGDSNEIISAMALYVICNQLSTFLVERT